MRQITSFTAAKELFDKVEAADKTFTPFEVSAGPQLFWDEPSLTAGNIVVTGWVPRAGARARGSQGEVCGRVRVVGGETGRGRVTVEAVRSGLVE